MVFTGVFTQGSSLIPPIIPRSEWYYDLTASHFCDMGSRVLLATICDKGYCPCPWCIIPKSKFSQVGWWNDLKARVSQARTYMQDKIIAARDAIYQLGTLIKGVAVEHLLNDYSLVPMLVSHCGVLEDSKLTYQRMHSQNACCPLVSSYSRLSLLTLCTSLNWAY